MGALNGLHVQVAAPLLLADRRVPAVGQRAAAAVAQTCGSSGGWRRSSGGVCVCLCVVCVCVGGCTERRQAKGCQRQAAAAAAAAGAPVTLYSLRQKFCVLVLALKLQWPCMMTCQMTCTERRREAFTAPPCRCMRHCAPTAWTSHSPHRAAWRMSAPPCASRMHYELCDAAGCERGTLLMCMQVKLPWRSPGMLSFAGWLCNACFRVPWRRAYVAHSDHPTLLPGLQHTYSIPLGTRHRS